ncbi:MAG: MATE family efflux transporter [Alphaproteobacteria bacterium]|nr:MATE family efflux transporter [Alphaproteobacteria bacterium]
MFANTDKQLWLGELAATYKLAWPLILTQLLHTSLGATDVVMMGWLSPHHLAAGGTASSFYFTFLVFGMGVVGAVSPLVAQAIGAKDLTAVRRSLRQGIWVALLLAALLLLILMQSEFIFGLLGQKPDAIELAGGYLTYASWSIFPVLIMVAFRSFLSGHNDTKVILLITILGFFLNFIGNYALMFGNWGFPRLELAGAGIATSIVQFVSTILVIIYIIFKKSYKHYEIFVRFWRPDWVKFKEILRVGIPIGLTVMAEVGLFSAAYFLFGLLSAEETAAHAVALQITSITFMIPFGLSMATTVRVGLAYGQNSQQGVFYAGWVSIILAFLTMIITCASFIFIPEIFIHLFLDPALSGNINSIRFAVSYLVIAGVFQLVDGVQVVSAAALRGLSDTKVPMYVAVLGYWAFGLPIAYILAFEFNMRGVGIWLGLACGLAFVSIILSIRFLMRDKLNLMTGKNMG